MDASDKLVEAYARLKALKQNIPGTPFVERLYADEFESLRDLLQKVSNKDLSGFRLKETAYDEDGSFCHSKMLLTKIDGLLTFFEIQWANPKPKMGFSP